MSIYTPLNTAYKTFLENLNKYYSSVLVINELEFVNNTITKEGHETGTIYLYMKTYLTDECVDKLYVDNDVEGFLSKCVMFTNFQALEIYRRMKTKDERAKFIESVWGLVRCKKTIDVADLKRNEIHTLINDVRNDLKDTVDPKNPKNLSKIFSTVTKSVVNNKNLLNTLIGSGDYKDVMKETQKTMEYMMHDPTHRQSSKAKKMMKKMKKMMSESSDEKHDAEEMKQVIEGAQSMLQANPNAIESMFGGLASGNMPDFSKMMNMEALMKNKQFKNFSKGIKSKLKK